MEQERKRRRTAQPLAAAQQCVEQLLLAVQQALGEQTALQTTRQIKCKSKQDSPSGPVERNWMEEEPTGTVDIGKVKEFTAVLEDLVSLKRNLFDLPTGEERERRKLAREKFALSKQKQELPEQPQLQVIFSEETEDWAQ